MSAYALRPCRRSRSGRSARPRRRRTPSRPAPRRRLPGGRARRERLELHSRPPARSADELHDGRGLDPRPARHGPSTPRRRFCQADQVDRRLFVAAPARLVHEQDRAPADGPGFADHARASRSSRASRGTMPAPSAEVNSHARTTTREIRRPAAGVARSRTPTNPASFKIACIASGIGRVERRLRRLCRALGRVQCPRAAGRGSTRSSTRRRRRSASLGEAHAVSARSTMRAKLVRQHPVLHPLPHRRMIRPDPGSGSRRQAPERGGKMPEELSRSSVPEHMRSSRPAPVHRHGGRRQRRSSRPASRPPPPAYLALGGIAPRDGSGARSSPVFDWAGYGDGSYYPTKEAGPVGSNTRTRPATPRSSPVRRRRPGLHQGGLGHPLTTSFTRARTGSRTTCSSA